MSTAEATELTEVLNRVKNWSPESRIVLARRILETLEAAPRATRGLPDRSVQELIGIGVNDSPVPDDQTNLPPPTEKPTRGVPVESVVGLLRTDREPPSDEECRQIVEEERWKKYGH